jgi:5'-phosphate synthase pdxT subunit
MSVRAGILALQGNSSCHAETFAALGVPAVLVRSREDLARVSHLVLPGGESTTIAHLLDLFDLREEIAARVRSGSLAVMGTCAGAILLGRDEGERPGRLGLLDASIDRNAYGRQVDSFARDIALEGDATPFPAIFIRAPKVRDVGPNARVLGTDGADPVLLEGPGVLASTFHPELSGDPRIHARFLALKPPSSCRSALQATPRSAAARGS